MTGRSTCTYWTRPKTSPLNAGQAARGGGAIIATPAATADLGHVYNGYWAASEYSPYVPMEADHPDYPHMPEPNHTFYPVRTTAGTADASVRYGRGAPRWDAWEWARGLMHDE